MFRRVGWTISCALLLLVSLALPAGTAMADETTAQAIQTNEAAIQAKFDAMTPAEKLRFMTDFPKGADLHNHLSGAVFAEEYIAMAKDDPTLCLHPTTLQAIDCAAGGVRFGELSYSLNDRMIDLWSMRNLNPALEKPYDHFFATFSDFGLFSANHTPDMVTAVARTALRNNIQHLELMISLDDNNMVADLVKTLPENFNYDTAYAAIKPNSNATMKAMLDNAVANKLDKWDTSLGCTGAAKPDYCNVSVRYIQQLKRNTKDNRQFFVQLVFGMELQQWDQKQRVVGINPVQIEYGQDALDKYSDQMAMLTWAKKRYGAQGHIALHAGEITPEVLQEAKGHDNDLIFHIRKAVATGADRIGHGASINWEEQTKDDTLNSMVNNHIAVEINLTSNEQILRMGKRPGYNTYVHPIKTYLDAGVPVVLSTDDPGVERTNLSMEYYRAAVEYGLTYSQLKQVSQDSLTYSFLPVDKIKDLRQKLNEAFVKFENAQLSRQASN